MKKLTYSFSIFLIFISVCLVTCKKETDTGIKEQEVFFSFGIPNSETTSALKGTSTFKLSDATKILLTIQNADGTATNYTLSEVKIYQMNGAFISQKILLKPGSYQLTEFLLLDSTNNTIFAAPMIGSQEAQGLTRPLPISFNVVKDVSTPVSLEVLTAEKKTPADFGLVFFPIADVKVTSFIIGVADKTSNSLLSAKLTVSNGSYVLVQNLNSVSNNIVNIKDGLKSTTYTITIEKNGWETYSHVFTKDSLKLFNSEGNHLPLLVELNIGPVYDIDGNVYHSVTVGTQVWLVENLKTTKYRNGDPIPNVTDNTQWNSLTTGAYYNYNNDENNAITYGRLYNWFAVNDSRNIAPIGWHVATDIEWEQLVTYLGGAGAASGKLKEINSDHWRYPNEGATNESGFTALPSGNPNVGLWWSSTGNNANTAWCHIIQYFGAVIRQAANNTSGNSVRCVRD